MAAERPLPPSEPSVERACAHCGLPVPAKRAAAPGGQYFCCGGCEAVYGVIRAAGLHRFYDLRADDQERPALPAAPSGASFGQFDDPAFHAAHVKAQGDLRVIDLYVEGVHCTACVWLIEKLPELLPGVVSVRLDFGRSVAQILFDPDRVRLSEIAGRLDGFGYSPHPFRAADRRALRRREEHRLLIRLGVAGAAAGNVMLVAVALYAGAGEDPVVADLFRWVSMLVTVPAVLWAGIPFFRGAWAGLRARTLHMDVPVSLALIGATGSSSVHTLTGRGDVYFDSVAMLTFLLLLARWLQVRALRAASDASELLLSLTPSRARVVEADGSVREVAVDGVLAGQVVEVRAGESIPVDGVVVQGQSRIDNALLTGEPQPVEVAAGSEVHAGAQNVSARVHIRVTATGENTRVGRLLQAVSEAQRRRAPIVQLADRVASYFVLSVLLLAGASAVLWWGAGAEIVTQRVVAMLVVTCPCALGLATPLALAHALGLAARRGIFVKGADTVEALAGVDTVLLDKTGTLTHGRVTLTAFEGPDEVLTRAAALEAHSSHPFALALVSAAPRNARRLSVDEVVDTVGGGVQGRVEGELMCVGSPAFVAGQVGEIGSEWSSRIQAVAARGASPVLVAAAGQVAALCVFEDPLRADSAVAVGALRRLGLDLEISSGDHPTAVEQVARTVGIGDGAFHGGVSPEGKLQRVERLTEQGRVVAMIGDGVNDAAALAAARVGIAVRGGAELSLATADVFLTHPGLMPAVELIRGCRAALGVVRRNLGLSLVYNLVTASLALAGWIGPLLAAILMPISSLVVVLSSVASRPFPRAPAGTQAGAALQPGQPTSSQEATV